MEAYKRFVSVERFGSLDGLRALSILAVLWHHSGIVLGSAIAHRGQMGVHLFFAISGFLITSLLIREKRRTGDISLFGFYARRSKRIFPLYYGALAVYCLLVAFMETGPDAEQFFANLPYFATYTSNWFVELDGRVIFFFAWSLAVEEQFYLTWPWIERYASELNKLLALGAAIAFVAANHFGLFELPPILHKVVWQIAPCILFGVLAAHVLHNPRGFEIVRRVLGHKWSAPAALATVVAILLLTPGPMWIEYAAYVALLCLVVACVIREDNGLAPVLTLKPMVRIGMVSYGIYMMHMLVYNIVHRAIHDPWISFPIAVLVVWGIAEVSFATYERFFLRLKFRKAVSTSGEIFTVREGI